MEPDGTHGHAGGCIQRLLVVKHCKPRARPADADPIASLHD